MTQIDGKPMGDGKVGPTARRLREEYVRFAAQARRFARRLPRPNARLLFDWDNTLVNTWPTIVECYHDTFTALGQTPWTLESARPRARLAARRFPQPVRRARRRGREVFYETLLSHPSGAAGAAAGAAALLARCTGIGCYVAVVSNKAGDNLRAELAHLGWQRWISRAVGARDCARDKPAPDPIFLALDGTGIAPDETVWMVGDTPAST